jgi:cystathionine gamma-synthase
LTQEKVKKVLYAGLPNHPGYEISQKQASGFGGMISFFVDSRDTAHKILEKTKLILFAESLGGVETLITYPMLQTHADVPEKDREARGINERLLRISVGIENIDDLIEDLAQAME